MSPLSSAATAATAENLRRLERENQALNSELLELRERLETAEATIHAIRSGEVDAVVVDVEHDAKVFTLASPEKFYLALAQQVANVGTWDVELSSGLINLSDGLRTLLGITTRGRLPLDAIWPLIHEADRSRIQLQFDQLRSSNGPTEAYDEMRLMTPGGNVRWMACKSQIISGQPIIFGQEGERLRLVGVNIDITERKAAEEALRLSEQYLQQLADSMPQIVWSARPDGTVEYFNRRWYEYTGLGNDGIPQRDLRMSVLHPDDRASAAAAWDIAIATGEIYQTEYRFRDAKTGQYRWHLGRAIPIHDDRGRIVRWFGTATDIHDQKLLQESLRDADLRKDEFLAMLAHELRNPLSPLMIASDLIGSEPNLSPHVREMAQVMSRQTSQLKRLIDDLLDVSRISTGRLDLQRERVRLRDSLEAALDVSRPLIDAAGHRLELNLGDPEFSVLGDKVRLAQIIGNLLINAAKYTPAGGRISLTARREGSQAVIVVTDNGIGIPREMLGEVFGLFKQVDSSTTRSQSGLGIGLTLVKTLVEKHGGTVVAESEGPGHGSTFRVSLPAIGDRSDSNDAGGHGGDRSSMKTRRILIVDDNQSASFLLGRLLTKLDQEVRVEHQAADTLPAIREFQPDIVISDIAMPGISGHELARQIRGETLDRQPILIALTGYGQEEDRSASLSAGFDHHFTKPIDIATLRQLLAQP